MIIINFSRRAMATNALSVHNLVDIGANLTHKKFRQDIHQVLQRAAKAHVSHVIITGTSLAGSRDAIRMTTQYNQDQQLVKLYSTVGIHPHDATRHSAYNYREQLVELLQTNKKNNTIVALGECGLDFDRNFSLPDDQRRVFDTQVQLACEFNLPLFMHERSASTDMLSILDKYSQHENFRGVIHCFTNGSLDILQRYLSLNLYIGITGWICDERRGKDLAKLIPHIPLDRLLIETDAPFLLPRNMPRPWPDNNEPSYLPYVVKKLAECYSVSTDEIAQYTTENAKKLFSLQIEQDNN
jgi:TatD DNase family protein